MSTLKVTNIQDTAGGNSSTSAEIYSGRAKAWVNFNAQGTVAIRASFNVSSITDNAVGNWSVNFSSALSDANYSVSLSVSGENGTYSDMLVLFDTPNGNWTPPSTTTFKVTSFGQSAYRDPNAVCVSVFR